MARRFLSSTALTVFAAGPLYGLGYKFALTVFMENIRVGGSIIRRPSSAMGRSRRSSGPGSTSWPCWAPTSLAR